MDTAAAILFFQTFNKTSIMANGKIICRSPSVFTICYLDLKNVPKKLRPREAPTFPPGFFPNLPPSCSPRLLPTSRPTVLPAELAARPSPEVTAFLRRAESHPHCLLFARSGRKPIADIWRF